VAAANICAQIARVYAEECRSAAARCFAQKSFGKHIIYVYQEREAAARKGSRGDFAALFVQKQVY
jgi:hypothetical protein